MWFFWRLPPTLFTTCLSLIGVCIFQVVVCVSHDYSRENLNTSTLLSTFFHWSKCASIEIHNVLACFASSADPFEHFFFSGVRLLPFMQKISVSRFVISLHSTQIRVVHVVLLRGFRRPCSSTCPSLFEVDAMRFLPTYVVFCFLFFFV